jgi:hypothetical protein
MLIGIFVLVLSTSSLAGRSIKPATGGAFYLRLAKSIRRCKALECLEERPVGRRAGQRAAARAVFASRIQQHLDRCGVPLRAVVYQTDSGATFQGDFPKALGHRQHAHIPPLAHTHQGDLETVHRFEEYKFCDLEDFFSGGGFPGKVHTYQLYLNILWPNSDEENQSPWQIVERLAPRSPLELYMPPINWELDRANVAIFVGMIIWLILLESHLLPRPIVFLLGPIAIFGCICLLVPSVLADRWRSILVTAGVASALGYLLARYVFSHP